MRLPSIALFCMNLYEIVVYFVCTCMRWTSILCELCVVVLLNDVVMLLLLCVNGTENPLFFFNVAAAILPV